MRECSGARNEAELGIDLFTRARNFHNGKSEDNSAPAEDIDAKIKLFLSFIAQQRVEVLSRPADARDEILAALEVAEEKIVETQIAFAQVKYTDDPDLEAFDALLEDIKLELKSVIDLLDASEVDEPSKQDRRLSAGRLMQQARKQMRELNTKLEKKEDAADSDADEDILLFVEQTLVVDAGNARQAAAAYRGAKEFMDAQAQAFAAIHIAQSAKQTLSAIE
jgi:translation elongation factor EF-Tu-like GTPase